VIFETLKFIKLAPDSGSASTFSLSAGTTDVTSTVIDFQAHQAQEVAFIVDLGAIAASGSVTIKFQHSDDNSAWSDVEGSSQATSADTDDDKRLGLQINRITKRYGRLSTVRGDGGNSAISQMEAILGKLRAEPPTQLTSAGQFIRQPEVFGAGITGTA
jgi:hypothetical protein